MGKNWAGPFFPHPDKIKHQPVQVVIWVEKFFFFFFFSSCSVYYRYINITYILHIKNMKLLRIGAPSFHTSQTYLSRQKTKIIWFHTMSYLQLSMYCLILKVTASPQSGVSHPLWWWKTWLVHSFPTLTSESINLTLSWIRIQPLLFRGWGKIGPAHSFPTLTSESINLVQKLGYLGGAKLGEPILSPPRLVKVSTLPCHEYANNHCFFGGGEKLGQPILSPP